MKRRSRTRKNPPRQHGRGAKQGTKRLRGRLNTRRRPTRPKSTSLPKEGEAKHSPQFSSSEPSPQSSSSSHRHVLGMHLSCLEHLNWLVEHWSAWGRRRKRAAFRRPRQHAQSVHATNAQRSAPPPPRLKPRSCASLASATGRERQRRRHANSAARPREPAAKRESRLCETTAPSVGGSGDRLLRGRPRACLRDAGPTADGRGDSSAVKTKAMRLLSRPHPCRRSHNRGSSTATGTEPLE